MATTPRNVSPLAWSSPIVDEQGRPTRYFIEQWALQNGVNQAVDGSIEDIDGLIAAVQQLLAAQINTGTGLEGGDILANAPIDLVMADTAVTPGAYGSSTHVGQFTVDQQGRLTAAQNVAIAGGGGGSLRGALVYRSTDGTANTTWAKIMDAETALYDTDSLWDIGSPSRLTVPADVTYVRLSAGPEMTSENGSQGLYISFVKNGSTAFIGNAKFSVNADSQGYSNKDYNITSAIIPVVEGDYFELRVNASPAYDGGFLLDSWFSMEIIQ